MAWKRTESAGVLGTDEAASVWGRQFSGGGKGRIIMAKITNEMVHESYETSKRVYAGSLKPQEGADLLNNKTGMDKGSAMDYIHSYKCMMNGEGYSMTMNEYATKYFLTKILLDNGQRQLQTALESVRQHLEYQDNNGHNSLANIKRLYRQYLEIINGNCWQIVQKIFELFDE
jgi:hypothetical protein